MYIVKIIIEKIANLCISISNAFNLFSVKLIDKFQINIYKPKHEEEILQNTNAIKENTQKMLKKEDEEIKKYKDREKIIKELINREIINVNNLNKVSNSEHYIIIPRIYLNIRNKRIRRILFGKEGSFKNSIFKYFDEKNFINIGKKFAPIYLKDVKDIQKAYRGVLIFKKILDEKIERLLKEDNKEIIRLIQKHKNNREIKAFFLEDVKNNEFLFLDYIIVSSLNLNKENITITKNAEKNILFKILTKEAQNVKLKEIILESGLRLFLDKEYPQNIKERLLKNESLIKQKLKIENFFQDINKVDFDTVLKELLSKDYKQIYSDNFFKIQGLIKDL